MNLNPDPVDIPVNYHGEMTNLMNDQKEMIDGRVHVDPFGFKLLAFDK